MASFLQTDGNDSEGESKDVNTCETDRVEVRRGIFSWVHRIW